MPPKRRKMATSISIDFVSTDDEGKGSAAAPIDLVSTDDETEASQEVTVKATTLPESTASETCIMHIASNLKVFRSMSHTDLALVLQGPRCSLRCTYPLNHQTSGSC